MHPKYFLFFAVLIAFTNKVNAQENFPINPDTKEIEFVKIINIDSSTLKNNFNKSKLWIANGFTSANDVIQYENMEEGRLVCKGLIEIQSTGMGMNGTIHKQQAGNIFFTMEISNKDNKSRIKIYNIIHEAEYAGGKINNVKPDCGGVFMTVKTWKSIQKQAFDKINSAMGDFEKTMHQGKSKDEW